jgi:diguanylate cyclase (GGDEF)-like protein
MPELFNLPWIVLHEFLNTNRTLLIDRCRVMVASRSKPKLPQPELAHGIPTFLDQIIKTLTTEQKSDFARRDIVSHQSGGVSDPDVGPMATLHGRDLLEEGFTIEQVIRDYGDVCQAVTNLAVETGVSISANEFRTFNRCLDDAIAGAVTEYSRGNSTRPTEPGFSPIPKSPRGTDDREHLQSALTQSQIALAHTEAALSAAQLDVREAQLRALHDSLTGLPNRELFDDRLAHAIALADRHEWTLAVMFLDLDQFKSINDAHGHTTGDIILKIIAERLLVCVRDEDTVCRNGGDEFLYLLMNPRGKENIEQISDSVLRSIAQPVAVGALEFVVKPSIGIATYPDHGSSGDQLITNADTAMYRAKKHSRGVAFFDRQQTRDITE